DCNRDGWHDLIVGGGRGGTMAVYLNQKGRGFKHLDNPVLTRDQTTILGFRLQNGTASLLAGSANYEDGLKLGASVRHYDPRTGRGEDLLPGNESTVGPLALGPWNGDGQLAL